jgi:hypothetical protein
MSRLGEPRGDVILQGITGVIRAECDSHFWRQGSHGADADTGLAPHVTTFA